MDIQYNDGPQAVRYLAKYLAKDDYEAKVMLKNIRKENQGFYQKSSYIRESDHYKTRIVGAVEAAYDIMGWHKHSNSRNVIFINTSLINHDSRRLRDDIKSLPGDSEDIFTKTHVQLYESRNGAPTLTMPEFFCFYNKVSYNADSSLESNGPSSFRINENILREFYSKPLPKYVSSGRNEFVLRSNKEAYWRTFNQSEMNGESYYYQQVVLKKAIFNTTFEESKNIYHSWKDYYEYLISLPLEEGGIPVYSRANVTRLDDIAEFNRGPHITKQELELMVAAANIDQKSIYNQIKYEMKNNSTAFISGAAGTGKSYVLRMLERYYRLCGFKVRSYLLKNTLLYLTFLNF